MTLEEITKIYRSQKEIENHEEGLKEWAEYLNEIEAGHIVEVSEGMFYYWLECLPPQFMQRANVPMVDGSKRGLAFGFCEGADRIIGFWSVPTGSTVTEAPKRYYAQQTNLFSRGD